MNINNFSNPLHLNNVKVNDNYFNEYLNLIKTVVIPYQYNALNDLIPGAPKSYCISNFISCLRLLYVRFTFPHTNLRF